MFQTLTSGLTFHLQDEVRGRCVADEALGRDAPQVDVLVFLWREAHAASCDGDATAGTQAAPVQHLEDKCVYSPRRRHAETSLTPRANISGTLQWR